jgi:large conductance mechanosensitive channel
MAENAKKTAEEKQKAKRIAGFMDFIRTQGVVGLAVGLAIGAQTSATVKSIVDGFITPMVGFVIGNQKGIANAVWNVIGKDSNTTKYWLTLGDRTLVVGWGAILSSLITLLAVAAVIFFVVRGLKLDKLDKKKDD